MKFNNVNIKGDAAITPNDAIALSLVRAMQSGHTGQESSVKVQGVAKMIAEDNNIVTQQAPDDLPTSKLAADIITTMENQSVVNEFNPSLNVEPGEIGIDTTDDEATGHKANADKAITPEAVETRMFFPKALYKLTRLDHKTYLTQQTIVKYAVNRASAKVADGLAQAILVGGLKNEDGTDYDAIKPIVGDTLATAVEVENDPVQIAAAMTRDFIDAPGENKVIFMASDVYKQLTAAALTNIALLQVLSDTSIYEIVPTKVLNGHAAYVVLDTANYELGFAGRGVETITDFVITQNSQYLEARLYAAGTLALKGGAIVATVKESEPVTP